MQTIYVRNFSQWRETARHLLEQGKPPSAVQWLDADAQQTSLFTDKILNLDSIEAVRPTTTFRISGEFIQLAEYVACHRSVQKWTLLYTALWRIMHGEKHLLQLSTDAIIYELFRMQKAVNRDMYKMKAFVRFKRYEEFGQEFYVAWHKPDHKIVQLVAPFFKERFNVMRWIIITPDGAVLWDGESLQFDETIKAIKEQVKDEMEQLWRTYYRATFNPARIKLKAMRREMPVRYWLTLPETNIIPNMLQEAPQRVTKMLKYTEGMTSSAADFLPTEHSMTALKTAAAHCQGCMLYQRSQQTVFGIGAAQALVMLVGDQPNDYEDQTGLPFQGAVGKILSQLLSEAGISHDIVYLTNAVKHFKHIPRDNKRMSISPDIREITACKPWLLAEIKLIQPRLIICLGLIAARALISHGFHMKAQRGIWFSFSETQRIMATYHPSTMLRSEDEKQQKIIYNDLLEDFKKINSYIENHIVP